MADADIPEYFAVIDYYTGKKVYGGTSPTAAATALQPGTVYGSGPTQLAATLDAKAKVKELRRQSHAMR